MCDSVKSVSAPEPTARRRLSCSCFRIASVIDGSYQYKSLCIELGCVNNSGVEVFPPTMKYSVALVLPLFFLLLQLVLSDSQLAVFTPQNRHDRETQEAL